MNPFRGRDNLAQVTPQHQGTCKAQYFVDKDKWFESLRAEVPSPPRGEAGRNSVPPGMGFVTLRFRFCRPQVLRGWPWVPPPPRGEYLGNSQAK